MKKLNAKQMLAKIAADERRAEKARAHAALMAQHAERRAAIALHTAAWDLWVAADCVGPMPIHPDNVGVKRRAKEFDTDLLAAARELGIDLSDPLTV